MGKATRAMAAKNIVVTGGNSGIGFALCKQLAVDYGCTVFLGSRSAERGAAAVASIELPEDCGGSIQLLQLDVSDDASVTAAAATVKSVLGDGTLYGLGKSPHCPLPAPASPEVIVSTNLYGTKRMCEAFLPLLDSSTGRIVNVGSGAGPNYVKRCPAPAQNRLCTDPESWAQIESWLSDSETGLGSA